VSRQLVFVHGRAQAHKDAGDLKKEWLDALERGLRKSGLKLPVAEQDVRFPYYGDTLFDMLDGKSAADAAQVIVRGAGDADEAQFTRAILREIQNRLQERQMLSAADLAAVAGQPVVDRGPLQWEWFHAFLRALDRHVPYGSGSSVALFTHDVYQYLKNSNIRETMNTGVASAMTSSVETVVVAHSLGSVVAYNLLRQQGQPQHWNCVLLVTVGSPLGIRVIRESIRSFAPVRCPWCVKQWFNALDDRDVVALYPLDTKFFPLDPAMPEIENKMDVRNETDNRHGIAGYLDDQDVARRIYDGLVAN